jgi:transcriptional regulator with XRE-family HTH domain
MTLKSWRKRHGIPLTILADEIGCSIAALSYIENGKRTPSMAMAAKLVKATKGEVGYADLHKRSAA